MRDEPLCTGDGTSNELDHRRSDLGQLIAEYWEWALASDPEFASILGDKRWNDRLWDFSDRAISDRNARAADFLKRFEDFDPSGLPDQEALNCTLAIEKLRAEVDLAQWSNWEMPVNQLFGPHLELPRLASDLTFNHERDYTDFVARMQQIPRLLAETTVQMRKGIAHGLVPPRSLVDKVASQVEAIAASRIQDSPFSAPLASFPETVSAQDQNRIRAAFERAICDAIGPAYAEFARFVRDDYAPWARDDTGTWSLPDGDERYATVVRHATSTALTPQQIHAVGLEQVEQIEDQMRACARRLGWTDLAGFRAMVDTDPDHRARSREQIVSLYEHYLERVEAVLPSLFSKLPNCSLEVRSIETFREKDATEAAYLLAPTDRSRPAYIQVNTGDYRSRRTFTIETNAYHEGMPGHHIQIALAQELHDLPVFRQVAYYMAFSEGWALYAERLAAEVGLVEEAINEYGRLQQEMLRAIRLVVDTGLHAFRWSRSDAAEYFRKHSTISDSIAQSEIDRYLAWPGQALGYKIGEQKLLALRARAKEQLGRRFDLRGFHARVLSAGAIPLDVLEERTVRWIDEEAGPREV